MAYLRAVMGSLQHNGAVAELLNEAILALDGLGKSVCNSSEEPRQKLTGIGNLGDLVALEAVPALVAACIDKLSRG
jgi:hypothetical protein